MTMTHLSLLDTIKLQYFKYCNSKKLTIKEKDLAKSMFEYFKDMIENKDLEISFMVGNIGENIFDIINDMYAQDPFNYTDSNEISEFIEDYVDAYR